jgi:hypothetical protein
MNKILLLKCYYCGSSKDNEELEFHFVGISGKWFHHKCFKRYKEDDNEL